MEEDYSKLTMNEKNLSNWGINNPVGAILVQESFRDLARERRNDFSSAERGRGQLQ